MMIESHQTNLPCTGKYTYSSNILAELCEVSESPVQEFPCIHPVLGLILQHENLRGLVDTRQGRSLGVVVKLGDKKIIQILYNVTHEYICGLEDTRKGRSLGVIVKLKERNIQILHNTVTVSL